MNINFKCMKAGFLLLVGLLFSGVSFSQFVVKGTSDMATGTVYLVADKDTLAKSDLKKGQFILRGKLPCPAVGYLVIDNKRYNTPLFIEKAELKVQTQPDAKTLVVEGAGELQRQQQEYIAALKKNTEEIDQYRKELKQAMAEENLGNVMHIRYELMVLDSVKNQLEKQFMALYPNSLVTLYHFYRAFKQMGYDDLSAKYDLLGDQMKDTEWGKAITERYLYLKKTAVGSIAPDFTLNTPDGNAVSLHEVKAKVKILDFWASWCGPCRAENPKLVALYQKYKEAGLEVISVSLDNNVELWEMAIEADELPWIHVSSLKGWTCPVAALYRVSAVPSIFLLDADNRIIGKLRGEELTKKVDEMLK